MYLQYYKRAQLLDVYRVIATIIAAFLLVTYAKDNAFQAFAITTWAIVLVFQSILLSFGIYWMLAANYKVWDTIRVGQLWEWEIIYIKPLYMWIAGRNNTGEHTGELFLIPNNKVRENPIIKVDYSPQAYNKIECLVYYHHEDFPMSFDEYMNQLTGFLDSYLPLRWAKNIGHIKSYIGYRYKLSIDYIDRDTVRVGIYFISKQKVGYLRKQKIISFVESLRTVQKDFSI
jgi:Mechanosensitive ion channel